MADEEVKNEQPEEKKEGKLKGFFKGIGKKIDDATYDLRLLGEFEKSHPKYVVFAGNSALQVTPEISVEEHLEEGYLITLNDNEQIAEGSLIQSNQTNAVVHIVGVEKTTLTVVFEGKTNEKEALKIILGDPAVKVDVIKVGNEFYLK